MSQVSPYLRRGSGSLLHWCPACEEIHQLPYPGRGWTFDGNLEQPTFQPSFKHSGGQGHICHYMLTGGVLTFHEDCSHAVRGAVPLPVLPDWLQDPCDFSDG